MSDLRKINHQNFLITGCIFACLSVCLGALGAHALKDTLNADQLESFKTGVRYQLFQSLAIIIFSQLHLFSPRANRLILWLFSLGIVLFSFSIYLLSCQDMLGIPLGFLGPITPIGGLLIISGWVVIIINIAKKQKETDLKIYIPQS